MYPLKRDEKLLCALYKVTHPTRVGGRLAAKKPQSGCTASAIAAVALRQGVHMLWYSSRG